MRLGRTPQGASAYQETPGAWCPELETKDEKGIQKADASSEFPIIKKCNLVLYQEKVAKGIPPICTM